MNSASHLKKLGFGSMSDGKTQTGGGGMLPFHHNQFITTPSRNPFVEDGDIPFISSFISFISLKPIGSNGAGNKTRIGGNQTERSILLGGGDSNPKSFWEDHQAVFQILQHILKAGVFLWEERHHTSRIQYIVTDFQSSPFFRGR